MAIEGVGGVLSRLSYAMAIAEYNRVQLCVEAADLRSQHRYSSIPYLVVYTGRDVCRSAKAHHSLIVPSCLVQRCGDSGARDLLLFNGSCANEYSYNTAPLCSKIVSQYLGKRTQFETQDCSR
jgi:hypothetical protein